MARPCRSFRTELVNVHPGAEAAGIHLVRARRKQHVDTALRRDARVLRLVAWIRSKVDGVTELRGIHEQRRNDDLVLRARCAEERAMALVEGAHRRHEPDLARELQVLDRADDPHVASASVAPASVS